MLRSERQDHAASIMMDAAREIERSAVREYLAEYGGEHGPEDVAAIVELIQTADITVEWGEDAYDSAGGR